MRCSGFAPSVRLAVVLIAMVLVSDVFAGAPSANTTAVNGDVVQVYRKAAAEHLLKLASTVGQYEFVFHTVFTNYDRDSDTPRVKDVYKFVNRTVVDDRLGGIRSDGYHDAETSVVLGSQPTIIDAINPDYRFEVGSEKQAPFSINSYSEVGPNESREARWLRLLGEFYGTLAVDFNGNALPRLLDDAEARITSARQVRFDGKDCVQFATERDFVNTGIKHTVLGKVIVDPAIHWSIVFYEEEFTDAKAGRRVFSTYNSGITEIAFPRHFLLEDHDNRGRITARSDVTFDDPTASHAKAEDFRLEAVGLARPQQTTRPPATRLASAIWINIAILVLVTIAATALILRSRRTVGNGKE